MEMRMRGGPKWKWIFEVLEKILAAAKLTKEMARNKGFIWPTPKNGNKNSCWLEKV